MKASDILKLEQIQARVTALSTTAYDRKLVKVKYADCAKQYDPFQHDVFDEVTRPQKEISKPSGRKDEDDKDIYEISLQDVARLAVPFQKIVVKRAASFLLNKGINRVDNAETESEEYAIQIIDKVWSDNKLDYRTKDIARKLFSECEVAELWYFKKEDAPLWGKLLNFLGLKDMKFSAKLKILANSLGDTLFPHFDETGDMDAFSRQYEIVSDDGKAITMFEVYTAEKLIVYRKVEGTWEEVSSKTNILKKIPVVYYCQEHPEWHDVQILIDRFETMLSNFADSNDYFGSPMIKVKGEVTGFAEKGEQGKVIQLEGEGADAEYMTWDSAPETIKTEKETLQDLIYSLTQTPDISFNKMMNMGNISGVSRKMMFLDAHLKSFDKEETFGEGIQRRLNLIKAMVGIIASKYETDIENIEIWPEFTPYLPSAEEDLINTLSIATGSKPIMSQETAVKLNPLVEDPEEELKKILAEGVVDLQEPTNL